VGRKKTTFGKNQESFKEEEKGNVKHVTGRTVVYTSAKKRKGTDA